MECINPWTQLSVEFASQKNYLDELFRVYPTIPNEIRELNEDAWNEISKAHLKKDARGVVEGLLKFDLFPIKDSYVAYLRRDITAIDRNPETLNRLSGRILTMSLDELRDRCSEPKETNRQIGPLFRRWLQKSEIGVPLTSDKQEFLDYKGNIILDGSDAELGNFAKEKFGYQTEKGLDLIAKFNGKFVLGEAKFLTDNGGHQNAQFNDAINLVKNMEVDAIKVAILDGVLYIKGNSKMYRYITSTEYNVMSALLLKEFLYQV